MDLFSVDRWRVAKTIATCVCVVVAIACTKEQVTEPAPHGVIEIPSGFPEMYFPEDNEPTTERIELGRKLFFDTKLSLDNSISCASCHMPEHAFASNAPVGIGIQGRKGERNAPSLFNVGYQPYLMMEGGVPTLEMQVSVPIEEHNEFDFNMVALGERIAADPEYVELTHKAYNRMPDPFTITRAIATFERSLLSGDSRFDRNELTPQEERGRALFFSPRLQCSSCHSGILFTTHRFANNGLYTSYTDLGRCNITGLSSDIGLFKIPSLRNVELTAPYMHDGSMPSLEAVVAHYSSGGKNYANKSKFIRRLNLTQQEQEEVVAFLKALTGSRQ